MSQLIEVRFIDPADGVPFFDEFAIPPKCTKDKEHQETIKMVLDLFCGVQDGIELKEMVHADEKYGRSYWRYVYSCILGLEEGEEREMLAVLFTEYRRPDMIGKEVQKLPLSEL